MVVVVGVVGLAEDVVLLLSGYDIDFSCGCRVFAIVFLLSCSIALSLSRSLSLFPDFTSDIGKALEENVVAVSQEFSSNVKDGTADLKQAQTSINDTVDEAKDSMESKVEEIGEKAIECKNEMSGIVEKLEENLIEEEKQQQDFDHLIEAAMNEVLRNGMREGSSIE